MLIDLEDAKNYFLCPINEPEKTYLIGDKDMMNHLASIMEKGDLISTAGVMHEECFLLVTWDDNKCEEMIKRANESLQSSLDPISINLPK